MEDKKEDEENARKKKNNRRGRSTYKWKTHIVSIMKDEGVECGDWKYRSLWEVKNMAGQREETKARAERYNCTVVCHILMLFIPCVFLQSRNQQTYAFNIAHSEAIIKLVHVSAPGCHHQGVTQNKGVTRPTANQVLCWPCTPLF